MVRIGAAALMLIALFTLFGCSEKATEASITGLEIRFADCGTFVAWVYIDGDYYGSFTSEQLAFLEMKSGSHTLYTRSNTIVADSFNCWTKTFSVSDGNITPLTLNCHDPGCR